jgi:hypothetical protein
MDMSERRSQNGRQQRGQTTLDFVIGISVFLAVLFFIFLFLPGILSPFTTSAQAETVSSNRVADQLSTGLLAAPDDPYVLDRHCTVQFFRNDGANCPFTTAPIAEQVGVASANQNLNVTMRGNLTAAGTGNDILCWDETGDDRGLVESSNTECDVPLTRGDDAPETIPSVTSIRVVGLDGKDATLYVEMW